MTRWAPHAMCIFWPVWCRFSHVVSSCLFWPPVFASKSFCINANQLCKIVTWVTTGTTEGSKRINIPPPNRCLLPSLLFLFFSWSPKPSSCFATLSFLCDCTNMWNYATSFDVYFHARMINRPWNITLSHSPFCATFFALIPFQPHTSRAQRRHPSKDGAASYGAAPCQE